VRHHQPARRKTVSTTPTDRVVEMTLDIDREKRPVLHHCARPSQADADCSASMTGLILLSFHAFIDINFFDDTDFEQ
jgi:hypothetical protein